MEIVDLVIIVTLLAFAIAGFVRGVFKSLVMFVGFILVVVISYYLKNFVGDFFTLNFPFVNFGKYFGYASTLNIIAYQAIAFLGITAILTLVYKMLIALAGGLEKILKLTVILSIPSKLLGLLVCFIEGYVIIYLALFMLSQPFFQFTFLDNSKYAPIILNKTPILSSVAEDSLTVVNEIRDIINREDKTNIDLDIADLILKDKVTSPDVMQKLVDNQKITIDGIQEVIDKYKGDDIND